MTAAQACKIAKTVARERYAWPGGYELFLVTSDGGVLCAKCARAEFGLIARSTIQGAQDGWRAEVVDIHWEGAAETCAHCNAEIPSAYGEEESA